MDVPEVRQDRRPGSPTFGAVAVAQNVGSPLGEWAYMSTASGGGKCTAAEIADWTVMGAADD